MYYMYYMSNGFSDVFFICTYFPWFSMVFPYQTWMDHLNLGALPQFALALRLRNFSMAEQKGLRCSRNGKLQIRNHRSGKCGNLIRNDS